MALYTEGLKSGVLSNDLLLAEIPPDSGGLTGQAPLIVISASVSATIEIQVRNDTNTGNVWAQRLFVSAAAPVVVIPPPSAYLLQADERLRVQLITGIIGAVQATLFT